MALAELIAAWNCLLQSEKSMLAAGWLAEDEADAEPDDAEPDDAEPDEVTVLAGGVVARSLEVHAAVASSARPAAITDRRVTGRMASTC